MKRYYIETDGHNMVAYVDGSGRAFVLTDSIDNDFSTLAAAKTHDYAEIDGMTIDEMDASIGGTNNFIVDDFDIDDSSYSSIQEF